MKFIGDNLRSLRKARNMTMTQLAEETGIKQGALSQIENEIKNPRPDTVDKIAKSLGIDCQYFYIDQTKLATEYLPAMSKQLKAFLMSEQSIPYLIACEEANANGISHELLSTIIKALIIEKKGKTITNYDCA